MSRYRIEADASALADSFGELRDEVEKAITDSVKTASTMTYAKAQELASQRLHSRLKQYQRALKYEEVAPGVWVVSLDESAVWIDDGLDPHSMVNDMLRNNPKTTKDGERYKVIPFEHSKPSGEIAPKSKEIVDQIKRELKAQKLPFKKLEKNPDGTPKLGKLHTFNFPSHKPTPMAKTPALHGLTIYQRKTSSGAVRRDVMTFRVVKDRHKEEGLWFYPGIRGEKIIDEVFEWIQEEFDRKILPEVLEAFK